MNTKRTVVLGAGGFAREVKWLLGEIDAVTPGYEFAGFVVSEMSLLSEHDSSDEVLGDFEWLAENLDRVDALAIGIGNPTARARLGAELRAKHPSLEMPPLIHPSVHYDASSCSFGAGTILCAGVIATVNVVVEDFAMVNLSCTLGHEARIGTGAVLNPTVNISGGVSLGSGVLVGTGAQILQYISVGDGAVVGAGAVVTRDVEAGVTVVGAPAKPLQRK